MKRRPKPKPRVTQLDRIELKLRKLPQIDRRLCGMLYGADEVTALKSHCAVLASHNRRLLEENETLKRWLTRLQARSTGTTGDQ